MECTIQELRTICLFSSGGIQEYPTEDMDEVYPGIFLGNAASAHGIDRLLKLNVGYVLNAAHGQDAALNLMEVHPAEVYSKAGIVFYGIPALDLMSYPLDSHFRESTDFIRQGLLSGKKVLVHCKMGISRSAALVLAYLVEVEMLDIKDATRVVREKREIFPNDGFLQQLCKLKPGIKVGTKTF